MSASRVKVGIVGLGRWAKVLTRASKASDKIEIVAGYSRSEGNRQAFAAEMGVPAVPELQTMLADLEIKGIIITVPNEQHLPLAREIAKAKKHVYTEKPIAATLEDGLEIEDLQSRYGVTVTVGHSARLMAGIRKIGAAIEAGELGRVAFMEANFSNERALELTPDTWRWYKARAGRPAVATRHPSVRRAALSRRRNRRSELDRIEAVAGRRRGRRPVDDAAEIRRR
jgi:predicted dehydrogenase